MSDLGEEIGNLFFLLVLFFAGLFLGYQSKGRGLLLECEKPLPRTERCVLTAVPEVKP